MVVNLGFKTNFALLSLWIWVEVDYLGIARSMYKNLKLLISLFDLKFVLTPESHISLE